MTLEEIIEKINNIKIGLAHHAWYDGWMIVEMKKELSRLQYYYDTYFERTACT